MTSRQPPAQPPLDGDEDDEPPGASGFKSLERWEIVTYLAWVICSLAIIAAWIWWHRVRATGIL